ncbi:MAG: phosphoserine aminotransferase [Thermoproteota archaeon]|jgi:phosphoserine aminotransferase
MFEKFKCPNELKPSDPRFGSGPSLIPVDFVESLAGTGMDLLGTSHRKPAVKNLVKEVQEGLASYFDIPNDYQVVLGNGGATFLFDMIGLGMVEKKSVHYTCGEFSSKWYKSHANIPWIEAQNEAVDYGLGNNPVDVAGADMICSTLNETSTGVQVGSFADVDANTISAIDATSGAGQIYCPIEKTDMFFFSPQKVFASEGGLFVSIMSPKAIERALRLQKDSSNYRPIIMDWKLAIDNSSKNQTYNTPAISTLYFLNEQVKLMNKLGSKACYDLAQKKSDLLYGWANDKDYLSAYVQEDQFRSRSVATIDFDDKIPVGEITKVLGELNVANGIDGYRKLGRNQLRISMFHNIKYDDLEKLTKVISTMIE